MTVEEIVKGSDIELDVKCNGKSMNFRSEIIAIKDSIVMITGIKVNDKTVGFSDKCYINFLYKTDGKLFLWENVQVKLIKFEGMICHKVELIGGGKPYNRREAFRMYIGEDMTIFINNVTGPTAISVLVKDISESGVGFITKEDLDVERTFRLKIKDNNLMINLTGIIVRKEVLSHLNSNLYGGKFIEKNHMLGKYIAKRQGEQIRNKTKTYSSPAPRDFILK